MLKKILLSTFLSVVAFVAWAQKAEVIQQYIDTYRQLAIDEMVRTGVPASIKLAQGIHETQAGQSDLVLQSNNHFGIKCKTGWNGEKVYHDDDAAGECFRKYNSAEASYRDHSDFLKRSGRYAFLFQLDPTDYKGWAYGLKTAGYATNIKYSQILIKLIEDYHLQDYTMIALGKPLAPTDTINTASSVVPPVMVPAEVENKPNYPAGVFEINRTKVLFAKAGTSLLAIAATHHISLAHLYEFNDMSEEDLLSTDQLVYLQRKRKIGTSINHIVLKGETLWSIAQQEGVRLESLCEMNRIQSQDQPAVGESLALQQSLSQAPRLEKVWDKIRRAGRSIVAEEVVSPSELSLSSITHKVQPKESLYGIARKYDVSVDELKIWNRLPNEKIQIGQTLIIYKKTTYDTGTR